MLAGGPGAVGGEGGEGDGGEDQQAGGEAPRLEVAALIGDGGAGQPPEGDGGTTIRYGTVAKARREHERPGLGPRSARPEEAGSGPHRVGRGRHLSPCACRHVVTAGPRPFPVWSLKRPNRTARLRPGPGGCGTM